MECRQAKEMLSPYIDDELGAAERAALEEHLAWCEACRSELEALRKISEGLKGIYQEVKAPPDFLKKLMKRIEEIEREKASSSVWDRLAAWGRGYLKPALAGALAVGLAVGAAHYGRAQGVNPPPAAAPGHVAQLAPEGEGKGSPAPGALSLENKDPAGPGEAEESAPGNVSPDPVAPQQGGGDDGGAGAAPRETAREKTDGNGRGVEPSGAAQQVAALEGAKDQQPRAFLSRERHVRTTWVKVEVDDLTAAKIGVAAAAARSGASGLTELWVYQDREIILSAVVPSKAAGSFAEAVAELGTLLEKKQETQDITAEFNNKVLEYQVLAAKEDEESREMAAALERHLEKLDGQTLEKGMEVVNVWLKIRRPD